MTTLIAERANSKEQISSHIKRLTNDEHIKLQYAKEWFRETAEALPLSEAAATNRQELLDEVFCLRPYSPMANVHVMEAKVSQWVEKYPDDPLNRTLTKVIEVRTKEAELCERLNLVIEQP